MVTTPNGFFFCRLRTQKETDRGHLSYYKVTFCSHFDEKKFSGTPKDGGRVSLHRKILSRHFEKYLHAILELELTEYVFINKKAWGNFNI